MIYAGNFTTPNNDLNVKFVGLYVHGPIIIQICSLALSGTLFCFDPGPCLRERDDFPKWKDMGMT